MSGLSIRDIYKSFGETAALQGVSFEIAEGEIVALLGPSGCGKSTLLSLIAGLEEPDAGEIAWNGKSLSGTPPHQRGFGLMFQDYALFPHKNVGANVAFGLEMAHRSREEALTKVAETLELVGLPGYTQRDINTLSGGEQQRVALARSLAPHPGLLMLDEPLGALDRALREHLLAELGKILRGMAQTALYVTHDQEESFALADRVVVMNQGGVAQIGTPQEIYRQPGSEFVARFLGFGNIMDGEMHNGKIKTSIGEFEARDWIAAQPESASQPIRLQLLLRPDVMRLDQSGSQRISGTVLERVFRGSFCRVVVEIRGTALNFEFPSIASLPEPGKPIALSFNPKEAFQILR
jgi:thiamine transport system ATP-binding protein